jgi:hypothetical protein
LRAQGVRVRFEGNGAFAYVRGKGRIYELNETAALVLRLADGTHELEEIVDVVKRTFDCDLASSVMDDVRELVLCLQKLGIVNV